MATAALRGGSGTASSTLSWVGYRGLANSTAIPDGANEDVNGNNPVLITRIRAWVRGKDASRSIRFEIGNFDTSFFTVTSGTAATLSSYQTINAYYANGGNQTFRIKTSALNAYIYYGHSAASNFNIVSINSDDSTATTLQTNRGINGDFEYFSVPTAPTSLARTEGAEGTFVDLSWSAPASNGGSAITGYRVQYSLSSNFSSPETVNTNSSVNLTKVIDITLGDRAGNTILIDRETGKDWSFKVNTIPEETLATIFACAKGALQELA
jgi:hypothetical protein